MARRLLGVDLVIWRDDTGEVRDRPTVEIRRILAEIVDGAWGE